MPPRTRAGSRVSKFRPGYGRISDSKIAWLRTATTNQIALLAFDNNEEAPEDAEWASENEEGTTYLLVIPIPGRTKPLTWNFSAMTTEELQHTRQFFNYLFDLVDPVVRERDKVANDANSKGDDSFARLYRPPSQFIVRARPKQQDSKGVRLGPEGSPSGDGSDRDNP